MRNGKIEFLRFVFSVFVLLFHCGKYLLPPISYFKGLHLSLFGHGSIAVEFFFIVSGFLMAKSVYKRIGSPVGGKALFTEYTAFMRKKYFSIFPMHCIAFVPAFVTAVLFYGFKGQQIFDYFLDSLPNLFLVEMTGLRFRDPNHFEWYISCMLLAMAVFYPLLRRFYHAFTRWFAPVFSLLLIGYLIKTTGSLSGVTAWTGICYKSFLRALSEIALGTCCFECSQSIAAKEYTKKQKILLTVAEWVLYALLFTFSVLTFPIKYEGLIPFILVIALSLSFSGQTGVPERWNKRAIYFLGKLSLPIYLCQITALYLVRTYGKSLSGWTNVWIAAGSTIILSVLVYLLDQKLHALISRKKASPSA